MWLVWLLWVVVVFGGAFMGWSALAAMSEQGFRILLLLNALIYFGCALYGLPRLLKLVLRRS